MADSHRSPDYPSWASWFGMFTLKESTRWLTKKERHDEAWESLKWIRADKSQVTMEEMEDIRIGVKMEQRATEVFHVKEIVERDNFNRVFTAFAIFTAQQATGAIAFAYYGPQYFKLLVGGGNQDLLLTAIFGAIKIVACGVFVLFLSNRVGRRAALIGGAVFMSACQITTAVWSKSFQPPRLQVSQVVELRQWLSYTCLSLHIIFHGDHYHGHMCLKSFQRGLEKLVLQLDSHPNGFSTSCSP
ncbi:hypothetical protein BOTCAL_0105g00060 [Botryotinia calthae]|uniref:Major facilitator superfamily (MFS) profile domain-containing protein n=1 Tax=Botryotinia calthae TaxID=38488 RepID=A0A4Y8D804_9HELO|nr:hypothetical protein BOTCAL_0105g00060 [Botryotinia calthae]